MMQVHLELCVFIDNRRKLSKNYHHLILLNKLAVSLFNDISTLWIILSSPTEMERRDRREMSEKDRED